jgi:hypothetical protein
VSTLPIEDFCTLPAAAQPMRLKEFDELFRYQFSQPRRIGPHRVELSFANADGLYAQVSDLVVRESACCSFFEFTIEAVDQDRLVLRVGVPPSRVDVLQTLTDQAAAAFGEVPNGSQGRHSAAGDQGSTTARLHSHTPGFQRQLRP